MRNVTEQMKFAFYDGGMVDSGNNVEPTTGNEIPPGSLDDEVSDKVDAKLSEGEYVLPANVVQFYGLDKIEKMVSKAKETLSEMEKAGRIGGKPIGDEGGDDDELPLTDEELGFAQGGMVPETGVRSKTFVGPNGEKRSILFAGDQPIQAIPAGYVPEGTATAQKKEQTDDELNPLSSFDGPPDDADTPEPNPVSEWGDSDFNDFIGTQDNMRAGVTAVSAIGGPMFGGIMSAANNTTGAQALAEVEARLENSNLSAEEKGRLEGYKSELEGFRGKGVQGLFGGLFGNKSDDKSAQKQGGLAGALGLGTGGILGSLFGGKARSTATQTTAPTSTTSTSSSGGISRSGGSSGSSSSSGNPDAPGAGTYSGMAKGGLVKRRKK